ncbi:hypothetical protein KIN20_011275 [Parelaphostrongylus tenuis]|uniref:Uncharacterized protein n=1 Tax=Parelaphostrongylus tenuis TaxID=148309 RepID=A0AAD5M946_PARTN|nr:hypothetical protein KIN20_011275 [Parelaphostrongylus tenuis]
MPHTASKDGNQGEKTLIREYSPTISDHAEYIVFVSASYYPQCKYRIDIVVHFIALGFVSDFLVATVSQKNPITARLIIMDSKFDDKQFK